MKPHEPKKQDNVEKEEGKRRTIKTKTNSTKGEKTIKRQAKKKAKMGGKKNFDRRQ
jgi:hypothetical protein